MNDQEEFNTNEASGHEIIIESSVKYIAPPVGSNVAREIIRSLRDENASKIVLVDAKDELGREFSGLEVWHETSRLATGLMKSGVNMQVGDRVLLMVDHSVREKLMALATLYTGATLMGSTMCGFDYLRDFCGPAQPGVIVTNNDQFEFAGRLKREVPGMDRAKIVLIDREGARELIANSVDTIDLFLGQDLFEWPEIDEELIRERVENDIIPSKHHSMLVMTSGSTGRSKVVPWTHERQLSCLWSTTTASRFGDDGEPMMPMGDNLVLAGNMTLDAPAGTFTMLWCFIVGGKYVLIKYDDYEQYWRDVCKYKITTGLCGTSFACKLLKLLIQWIHCPIPGEQPDISSMQFMTCGGHRVNLNPVLAVLKPHYPHLKVAQYYGTTELGHITILSPRDAQESFDCLGKLYPGICAKVVDVDSGKSLGPGEEGELLVKSPIMFDGYLPYPGENFDDLMRNRMDEQGFYRTGDLVHYDEQQRFYMHGRLNEYLCSDLGWKVLLSEIEAVVNRHPLVESSVVVGIPNANLEGIVYPKAFIKLRTLNEVEQLIADTFGSGLNHDRYMIHQMELLNLGHYDQILNDINKFCLIDSTEEKKLKGGIEIVHDFSRIAQD